MPDRGRAWDRRYADRRPAVRPVPRRGAWFLVVTGTTLLGVASVLVRSGVTGWDECLYRWLNDVPTGVAALLTPFSKLFLPLGITVAVVAGTGYCAARNRSLWPVAYCVGSAVAAWFGANLAKALAERPRPYEVEPNAVLRQQPAHGTSFPSSHTAVAVAVALTLIPYLPRGGAAIALGYASMVAWSRIYLGVHYPLDVIGGAGIGLMVGGGALLLIAWFHAPSRTGPADLPPDST